MPASVLLSSTPVLLSSTPVLLSSTPVILTAPVITSLALGFCPSWNRIFTSFVDFFLITLSDSRKSGISAAFASAKLPVDVDEVKDAEDDDDDDDDDDVDEFFRKLLVFSFTLARVFLASANIADVKPGVISTITSSASR